MRQLKLNFPKKSDYHAGYMAGRKDKPLKRLASEEYKRGYVNGRNRRDTDL